MKQDASVTDSLHVSGFAALDQEASLQPFSGFVVSTSDAPLVLRRADGWFGRAAGLLVGPRLQPGHGLWLLQCRAVHTIGMRYPIAVFFLDEIGRVTSAIGSLNPGSWSRDRHALSVVETHEIRAGGLSRAVARVEHSVRLTRGDPRA